MKRIKILLALVCLMVTLQSQAQALKTVRTYYDLWSTKPHEVYTVLGAGGQKHGTYKAYDEEGFIYAMFTYSKGIKNGPWKYYGFSNGGPEDREKIREEGNFLNGKEHGRYKYYILEKGQRQLKTDKLYDNNMEMEITNYYDNGVKSEYMCRNGIVCQWYESGVLKKECEFKDNQQTGVTKEYYSNGILQSISNYKAGILDGKAEVYYEDGKKKLEQHFIGDKRIGEAITYLEDGTISSKIIYGKLELITKYTIYFRNGHIDFESILMGDNHSFGRYSTTYYDEVTSNKICEITQNLKEVTSHSKDGYSKRFYYPNNSLKEEWTRKDADKYKINYYKEDGTLDYMLDYDGSKNYFYTGGVLAYKINPPVQGLRTYQKFDKKGEVIETGELNGSDKAVTQKNYSDGVRVYEKHNNGIEYWYYPNGEKHKVCNSSNSIVFEYDEYGKLISRSTRNGKSWVYNYPENTLLVRAKGEMDKDGNRIGKWYLYNEKGKLKIEENDILRKPTKDEKVDHLAYLQDLIKAKP